MCNPMFSVLCVIPCLVCSVVHILFFRVCPVLHGPQQWTNVLLFPSFCQPLLFFIIFTNSDVMRAWGDVSSALTCVSSGWWQQAAFLGLTVYLHSFFEVNYFVLIRFSFLLVIEIICILDIKSSPRNLHMCSPTLPRSSFSFIDNVFLYTNVLHFEKSGVSTLSCVFLLLKPHLWIRANPKVMENLPKVSSQSFTLLVFVFQLSTHFALI